MKIIPAIDLLDGEVVRLYKGDYNQKKVYHKNPLEQAQIFKDAGFDHIHIVDLNGAKTGNFENLVHIKKIIKELGISVQTGGGIRSVNDIDQLLNAGVNKVICSSMAVKKPADWYKALTDYPGRCILGLDLKNGKMAYGGWMETSNLSIRAFLEPMIEKGLQEVLTTDISKDGTLEGPNIEMYRELQQQFPKLRWIASGGVSSLDDLKELKRLEMYAVIVGKAYYEGMIELENLLNV